MLGVFLQTLEVFAWVIALQKNFAGWLAVMRCKSRVNSSTHGSAGTLRIFAMPKKGIGHLGDAPGAAPRDVAI
jgi:hypothetical protein